MRRYVILTHDHPHLHWDLMVESGGVLRTWRLAAPPGPDADVPAEPIGDHRLAYLDYEGPVGGGRGYVTRWDAGMVDALDAQEDEVRLRLAGDKLCGELDLRKAIDETWSCRYSPAGPA